MDAQRVVYEGTPHAVTIKNRFNEIQPVGGWGCLYLDGENTGKTARLTMDGTVDLLQNSGRCVMQETLVGRHFVDLGKLELALSEYPGVNSVKAYITYGENNKLVLTAEIIGEDGLQLQDYRQYALEKFKVSAQPSKLFVNGIEVLG